MPSGGRLSLSVYHTQLRNIARAKCIVWLPIPQLVGQLPYTCQLRLRAPETRWFLPDGEDGHVSDHPVDDGCVERPFIFLRRRPQLRAEPQLRVSAQPQSKLCVPTAGCSNDGTTLQRFQTVAATGRRQDTPRCLGTRRERRPTASVWLTDDGVLAHSRIDTARRRLKISTELLDSPLLLGAGVSSADSIGHGARALHFYKWLGTGAPCVEEQQIRNWPNCTDHHESADQCD